MTVYSHLIIFCAIKGIPFLKQIDYIVNLLRLFEMEEAINQQIADLSGGSKRKLKLITSLIGKSKFIFLDEATIGIDEFSRKRLREIIEYLSKEHKITCLLISHKLE